MNTYTISIYTHLVGEDHNIAARKTVWSQPCTESVALYTYDVFAEVFSPDNLPANMIIDKFLVQGVNIQLDKNGQFVKSQFLGYTEAADQDFTATVGVDEVQEIAVEEIARQLTAAELESVYAFIRRNHNFSDGLSYENFRVAIEELNFDVA